MTRYPYRGYSAHIICITLGLDMHYGGKDKHSKDADTPDEDSSSEEL